MKNFDVVVIGGGPGGYVAAIRCAQLGLNTACIESWLNDENEPVLGGTCLNVGCIPSKALLDSSHHYSFIKHEAKNHGINAPSVSMDVHRMIERKKNIVQTLTQGIAGLFKKNKIEWLKGHGRFVSAYQIEVQPAGDESGESYQVTAKHIIIATGSVPMSIPPAQVDNELVVDSTGALAFTDVPRRLGVIGAGVIGLELGSVWNRLGSEVVILEAMDEFLAPVDRQLANEAEKLLKKQGLDIRLGSKVTGTGCNNREVTITYENDEGKQQVVVDKLIVAVGRKPNTQGLGANEVGITMDERGFIQADEHCRTNLENVFAIGDVVRGPMLAHKASEEGVAVAERIAGKAGHLNYDAIPWVIYTWPEIAWVGKTEHELKAEGADYRVGNFPMAASGRARAMGETDGMVKMISDSKTDRILGVHILGPNASELISEAVLAMEFDGSSEDIARTIHAHPTLAEAVHEASLAVDKRSIHF
ncbi:MAG: dihydrolipoyl dehydrogenase [Gammaproteobacteria bacterium]|jgi:dihydrolipoamide dehydrogenase|nr:dihydrolipoyl dehydrogenase [Gammaproteobacteria bacterium]